MGDYEWREFRASIDSLLRELGAIVFVDAAESIGEWKGVSEESLTWVAEVPEERHAFIISFLEETALIRRQDAIAYTLGATTLVEPARPKEA
jgi:hypothetical protein